MGETNITSHFSRRGPMKNNKHSKNSKINKKSLKLLDHKKELIF